MGELAPAPVPTDDLSSALSDVRRFGAGVLTNAMSRDEAASIRERLWTIHQRNEQRGHRDIVRADRDDKNIRLLSLINDDPFFGELAVRDIVLDAVRGVLGERFVLSNYSANITGPGSVSMAIHADQGFAAEPWPPVPLGVNVGWMIDDFTEEVGATCIVPDTGKSTGNPQPDGSYHLRPLVAPAGSLLIMDARTWHTSGPNRSADTYRAGIFGFYVLPWIRQTVNWHAELDPEAVQRLSADILDVLGYSSGNRQFVVKQDRGTDARQSPDAAINA